MCLPIIPIVIVRLCLTVCASVLRLAVCVNDGDVSCQSISMCPCFIIAMIVCVRISFGCNVSDVCVIDVSG